MGVDNSLLGPTEAPDGKGQSDWVPRSAEPVRNDTDNDQNTDPGWESIGQALLNRELCLRSERGHTQLHELAEQIQNRQGLDADDLRAAREQLDMVTRLVDEHLGPTDCGADLTEFDDNFDNRIYLCTEDAD